MLPKSHANQANTRTRGLGLEKSAGGSGQGTGNYQRARGSGQKVKVKLEKYPTSDSLVTLDVCVMLFSPGVGGELLKWFTHSVLRPAVLSQCVPSLSLSEFLSMVLQMSSHPVSVSEASLCTRCLDFTGNSASGLRWCEACVYNSTLIPRHSRD